MAQQTDKVYSIFDKTVDIEPSGVVYALKGSTIEEFVEDYLGKKGVDGINTVKLKVMSEGRDRPRVALYLFMSRSSKALLSKMSNVPERLRNKLDSSESIKLTDNFFKIISPMTGGNVEYDKCSNNEIFIKLNLFRVLGMMFAANPDRHNIAVTEVYKIPGEKDCVMSVIKSDKFTSSSGGANKTYDNRDRIIDNNERNERKR